MTYNLADLFERVADQVPRRTAIVCAQRRLSYGELDARANRLANSWKMRGLGRGNHIGLQLRNGSEYLEGMLAAYKLRAVPVNINYHYVDGELEYLYRDADLVALVTHQAFAPRVAHVVDKVEGLETVYCVADDSTEEISPAFIDYETALTAASTQRDFPPRGSDDIYIVYTGGTTGMPKGVMWHHEDIFFSAMGGGDPDQTKGPIASPNEIVERVTEIALTALPAPPFMHAAAQWLAFNTFFSGGKVVIPSDGAFEPTQIWQAVADEQVITLVIVGDAMATPLADVLETDPQRWDLSSLFVIASGGALFSPAVKDRLLKLLPGRMIVDGLGSSETGSMGNKISAEAGGSDSEPRFVVNEHMCVLDESTLSKIEPGTGQLGLLARKGRVPIGYYNAPEKSAKTFVEIDGERWAIPGDLATVNADGTILLRGRGSTSINSGGEKVFPEEVESAVKEHGDVLDAVVVGVADPRFGQQVVAVVQTRSGNKLEISELREFCRGRLAAYKLPRAAVTISKIKRSPAGKADYLWAQETAAQMLES